MYGTQTSKQINKRLDLFENDVKMYGTQTKIIAISAIIRFENDVKMYGTQTAINVGKEKKCLRMM